MSENTRIYIDYELLNNNCAGDKSMMRELVTIGTQSVSDSIIAVKGYLEGGDWDNIARVFHKLRPVLCYCGINQLTESLLSLESSAREKHHPSELTVQVRNMLDTLQTVHDELMSQLAALSE